MLHKTSEEVAPHVHGSISHTLSHWDALTNCKPQRRVTDQVFNA